MSGSKVKTKTKPPELKIVFDTNVLWNTSESNLLVQEVVELIRANSSHPDLTITWYLPEVVRHERQYQMLSRAFELLPSIAKLEKLLGHNLNITEQIIEQRVQDAIERQIQDIGLQILPVNSSDVDWSQMMLNAAYRRPPFSRGEKEKGFRDAIVSEVFLQLVSASPATPRVCRVALVSKDGDLKEAVKARTNQSKNVRVLQSIEDLKGLINTLVAEISEEFVSTIQEKALPYFFEVERNDTLYYKENIRNKIRENFQRELSETHGTIGYRENGAWRIGQSLFIKKQRQRVFWVNRISVDAETYRDIATSNYKFAPLEPVEPVSFWPGKDTNAIVYPTPASTQYFSAYPPLRLSSFATQENESITLRQPDYDASHTTLTDSKEKVLVKKGKTIFEVTWSVAVTTNGRLSAPRIESIDFIETIWE